MSLVTHENTWDCGFCRSAWCQLMMWNSGFVSVVLDGDHISFIDLLFYLSICFFVVSFVQWCKLSECAEGLINGTPSRVPQQPGVLFLTVMVAGTCDTISKLLSVPLLNSVYRVLLEIAILHLFLFSIYVP